MKLFSVKSKTPFLKYYDEVVGWMESGEILTRTGDKYKQQTIYNYKHRRQHLRAFARKRGSLYIEDIDVSVGEEFVLFLSNSNFCKNTIAANVAGFKSVLNILYRKKRSVYNGQGIRNSQELTTAVFCSIEDIQATLNTDFSKQPGLGQIRDIFVMQCFLGLRFSDFRRLLKDPRTYLREHGNRLFFELKTGKTGEVVVIPISAIVRHILGAYDYDFGESFSYQYYNKAVKEIAEKAGITNNIECTRTRGGVREDYIMRKCDMISSHTARRTFATNAVLSEGFEIPAIMKITGHRSITNFEKYVRCNVLESAISVAGNPFFSIPFEVQGKIIDIYTTKLPALKDSDGQE